MNKILERYVEKHEKLQEGLALTSLMLASTLSIVNSEGWLNSKFICYSITTIAVFCVISSLLVYNYKKKLKK